MGWNVRGRDRIVLKQNLGGNEILSHIILGRLVSHFIVLRIVADSIRRRRTARDICCK